MSFLTPLFLFGLLAAAIPVAIHLIRREHPPKVMFGSLRFLKQTTRKLVLFQQVQQWLLLLLRAALICLLVLAFARPLFYQGSIARLIDAEPQSTVLLLDTSLSMRYAGQFEQLRQSALDVVDSLAPGDELGLITFADGTRQVRELTTDVDSLRAFITELPEPGYERARFFPALRLANDMLASARHQQRSVTMISDYQASAMGASAEGDSNTGWRLSAGTSFRAIDVGDERSSNLSLTDVRSPRQLMETQVNETAENLDDAESAAESRDVLARVRSTGSVLLEQGELSLVVNGETREQQSFDFRERSEAVLTLPLVLDGSGSYEGELVLTGDGFDVDNRWHFTLDVLPRMRVLVVNGDPAPDWYDDEAHWFVLALEGMENSPFTVTQVDVARFAASQIAEQDVVVLLNTASLPQAQLRALETYVEEGGSVMLAPGDRVDGAQFNQQMAALSPAILTSPRVLPASEYMLIADIDRRHPALQALDADWGARFQGYWQSDAADGATVLMRFDSGEPLLLERASGQGRTMLVTSSLDLGWSNFPLQGLYLPFVHETLSYLVQPPAQQQSWLIGDMVDLSAAFAATDRELTLREPDGNQVIVSADDPFYRARIPGFLRTETGISYAVNIQPEAASLARIDSSVLHDRILNPETTPDIAPEVQTSQLIAQIEQPQRLWWWILLLVLLLFALEAWIANRTYR